MAQAFGDYLEGHLASVCHEQDPSIVITVHPVLRLVQPSDRGIFPLLQYAPASLYGDDNGVELFLYTAATIAISI